MSAANSNLLTDFHAGFYLTVGAFIVFALTFGLYVHAEKQIDQAYELRQASLQLADVLRHSSDDLTRMARTYVQTGEPRYKQHFQEILEIRDGQKPRPQQYHDVYWDLVLADNQRPRPAGAAIPLLRLLREAGFTAAEFSKLAEVESRSNELAHTELAAMALVASTAGNPTANKESALAMLHDAAYHQAKARIMQPLTEFNQLLDQRTARGVRDAENTALLMRSVFLLFGALLAFMLWRTYRNLHATLGDTVSAIHSHISRLGSGDFSLPMHVPAARKDSVMGWLVEMQTQLRENDEQRQLAEQALQESIGRFDEAQKIAHLGSWHLNMTTGKLHWSKELFRIFEIDPAQFDATYDAFLNLVHADDRVTVNQAYATSLAQRTPYEITHRLRMADGRIKWVQERCTTDFNAAGKPLCSTGTTQDISAQKIAEEQLRIAATAFESQESMMVTDAAGVVLQINKAFTDTTGYAPEDIVGQTPRLLQSGRHDAAFFRAMWESLDRTGTWQGEVWDKHKSGKIYPKWLSISAVKDAENRTTHYIGAHYDITERKIAEERINVLAFYDQLTGLPNRVLLADRLQQSMAAAARNDNYGALLLIDMDNFKTLNDTQGHDMGDQLLKQVASRLQQCIREQDTASRQGGDEFMVLLSGLGDAEKTAASAAEAVAEKVLAALGQTYLIGHLLHHGTASIGVTLFKAHAATVDDVMKQADLAMYRAKAAGRGAVRFFDPAMEATVKLHAMLEADLRHAIEAGQLLLHYQPQVVGDGQLSGAEALVRWQHPQRGMVSPGDFIPLAEETNLILPLGRWVLATACHQLAAWARQPHLASLTIAVNVSAKQFRQRDFVEQVLEVVAQTGANPQRLKLELTESMLVNDIEQIIEKMHLLKARGIGFSLDDFGTGYSSLAYLKRLPLDQLKIDQSFVRDVLSDPNDAAIARTIVALAESLGLAVIAEGVETRAQRDFLASAGCHTYQGYFFSKPLPSSAFEQFAQAR